MTGDTIVMISKHYENPETARLMDSFGIFYIEQIERDLMALDFLNRWGEIAEKIHVFDAPPNFEPLIALDIEGSRTALMWSRETRQWITHF